jgi:hypothetical protein
MFANAMQCNGLDAYGLGGGGGGCDGEEKAPPPWENLEEEWFT